MQEIKLVLESGKEKIFRCPTSYSDISRDQYLKAVGVIMNTDHPEKQWELITLLMGMKKKYIQQLNPVQRVELLRELGFLYDETKFPAKDMIGSIERLGRKKLYGPGDGLSFLTFGEFISAETRLELFESDPEKHQAKIEEFLGILFRTTDLSRKGAKDRRIEYREGFETEYADNFQGVSQNIKDAILINYQGAKRMFPKYFRHLYPSVDENEGEKPTGGKKKPQALTWQNLLMQMGEHDVTKYPQIKNTKLYEALKTLDDLIGRNKQKK